MMRYGKLKPRLDGLKAEKKFAKRRRTLSYITIRRNGKCRNAEYL
jgi:hypothetical protein